MTFFGAETAYTGGGHGYMCHSRRRGNKHGTGDADDTGTWMKICGGRWWENGGPLGLQDVWLRICRSDEVGGRSDRRMEISLE